MSGKDLAIPRLPLGVSKGKVVLGSPSDEWAKAFERDRRRRPHSIR